VAVSSPTRWRCRPPSCSARSATHVRTVRPDDTLDDALRAMVQYDVGRLVVLDEASSVVGLLSRSDVLRMLYGERAQRA
jgi:predicted transcriptional regulator